VEERGHYAWGMRLTGGAGSNGHRGTAFREMSQQIVDMAHGIGIGIGRYTLLQPARRLKIVTGLLLAGQTLSPVLLVHRDVLTGLPAQIADGYGREWAQPDRATHHRRNNRRR
jgi:hypothetical protein